MTMGIDQGRLRAWLERGMLNPQLPRVSQVILGHRTEAGTVATIDSWHYAKDQALPVTDDIIFQIDESSSQWADNSGEGLHRFVVQMYHGENPVAWDTVFPFQKLGRAPEAGPNEFGFATEGATQKGLMGQLMRHNEALQGNFMKLVEFNQRFMMHTISGLQTRMGEMEKRHWDSVQLYEDLLDRRQERELKNIESANRMQRWNRITEILGGVLPLLAAKVLGGPLAVGALPHSATNGGPAMEALRQVALSIRDDQVAAIMPILTTEQNLALMQLRELVAEDQQVRDQAEEASRHIATTSRDDVVRQREQREAEEGSSADSSGGDDGGGMPPPMEPVPPPPDPGPPPIPTAPPHIQVGTTPAPKKMRGGGSSKGKGKKK